MALDKARVPGAILIGIVGVTVASFFFGGNQFRGLFSAPPSIAPTFLQLDVHTALTKGLPQRGAGVLPGRAVRRHRHADGRGQARRPAGARAHGAA
ncbi:permease protein [Alicycliphilus sp. B1]|nr:permease protein [Alicycliphilus sp. B1]